MAAQTELILQTAVKGTEAAVKSLNNVKGSLEDLGNTANKTGGFFSGLSSYFSKATDASKQLGLAVVGVGTVSAYGFTQISDNAISMSNALKQVTDSEEDLVKLQKELLDVANRSRVPVDNLTKSFVRFDKVNTALGGNQRETTQMLKNISKGLTLSGATAQEASSVMLQLSQAFGSGRLQGDEFRSVAENMPMVLDLLAKSLGVPRGELKNLASEGKITSQVLKEALLGATDEINKAFEKSSVSIGGAMQVLKNNALIAFIELDKQYGITQKVVEGITYLGKAFSDMMPYLTAFAAWFTENKEVILGVILGALTPAIVALGTAIGGALLTLSPFMLIGALIAKNWDTVGPILTDLVQDLKTTISGVKDFVKEWVSNNQELIKDIKNTFDKIKIVFSAFFDVIKTLVSQTLKELKMQWSIYGDEIKYILNAVFEAVKIIFSNGLDIIIGLLKAFKGVLLGDWNLVWEGVKQAVEAGVNMVRELFVGLFNGIQELIEPFIQKAKEWGGNMIQMFVDGLKEKVQALKDGIVSIATTIQDYLGFASPTKKGPGAKADKWMPNLITMLAIGLEQGKGIIEEKAKAIANGLNQIGQKFKASDVSQALVKIGDNAKSAFDKVIGRIDESKSKIASFKSEINSLNEKLKDLGSQRISTQQEGIAGIAGRAVDIQAEIDELRTQSGVMDEERIKKLNALTQELELAKSVVTAEDIRLATIEKQKSQTQLMIDEMKRKIIEIDTEIFKTKELIKEKQLAIVAEEEAYRQLNKTRIDLENAYYALFNQNITKIQDSIQSTITMMQRLASMGGPAQSAWMGNFSGISGKRANGGPVSGGTSYLVGEKGPEIFTPGTSGQIIPNHKIGGSGGNIVINITGTFGSDAIGEISDAIVMNLKRASYI